MIVECSLIDCSQEIEEMGGRISDLPLRPSNISQYQVMKFNVLWCAVAHEPLLDVDSTFQLTPSILPLVFVGW